MCFVWHTNDIVRSDHKLTELILNLKISFKCMHLKKSSSVFLVYLWISFIPQEMFANTLLMQLILFYLRYKPSCPRCLSRRGAMGCLGASNSETLPLVTECLAPPLQLAIHMVENFNHLSSPRNQIYERGFLVPSNLPHKFDRAAEIF